MGASFSKTTKRVDSFDPDSNTPNSGPQYSPSSPPGSPRTTGRRKPSNARPVINLPTKDTVPDPALRTPSPRGLRPASASSPRTSQSSSRSDRYNFLARNGIQAADARVAGDPNANHGRSGSQSSTREQTPQHQHQQGSPSNPYVLPGTIGTTLIEGTNYISNGGGDAQVAGAINSASYAAAGSYMASNIAHGTL